MKTETLEALLKLADGICELVEVLHAEQALRVDYRALKIKEACKELHDAIQNEAITP